MGIWDKVKQYGNLIVALSMVIGFGATFMLYDTGGQSRAPDQQEENNYTAPGQSFKIGSFDKSYNEQIVISAQQQAAFVNAYYDNESQRSQLESLQSLQETFPDRLYIQVVESGEAGDVPTQVGLTDYPSVAVVGGTASRRGVLPVEKTVYPVNTTAVEKAVCNTLSNLQNSFAYCQSIGAF
jgi:hypothetical protein